MKRKGVALDEVEPEDVVSADDERGARLATEHLIGLALTQKVRKACQEQAPSELRDRVLNALG